jgi:polyisoprenoid-binding protein YceI
VSALAARTDRRHRGIAALLACATILAHAEPVAYRVDGERTRVEFSVIHLGVIRADGAFERVAGRIVVDAATTTGHIDIDVAGDSVATGWSLRDAFIRSEKMFDVVRHPVVRFRSTRLEFERGRLVRVDGDLTLRGVTRPVVLTVASLDCGPRPEGVGDTCSADAEGTIHRRDFGMDFAWPLIDDKVSLRFLITATRE